MLVLIYTSQSIHRLTYCGKTSKVRLPLPVVNLDKASVCGDRKTSFSFKQKRKIGIHIYREFRSLRHDSYLGAQYRWVPTILGLITCMSKSLRFNIFKLLSLNIWITIRLIEAKFHVELSWDGGTNDCSNGPGHITKMAAMPIYDKNHWKYFSLESKGLWPWNLVYSMSTRVLLQICSNNAPWLALTYLWQGQIWSPMLLYWKKVETMDFSETIVVYDINVGRYSN